MSRGHIPGQLPPPGPSRVAASIARDFLLLNPVITFSGRWAGTLLCVEDRHARILAYVRQREAGLVACERSPLPLRSRAP